MSARVPVGASNRTDLFVGKGQDDEQKVPVDNDPVLDDGPVQLEHMIGFAGDYEDTIIFVPNEDNLFIKRYNLIV